MSKRDPKTLRLVSGDLRRFARDFRKRAAKQILNPGFLPDRAADLDFLAVRYLNEARNLEKKP